MYLKFNYYECEICSKQILKGKYEFIKDCPICKKPMKVKKIEINGDDNEQKY